MKRQKSASYDSDWLRENSEKEYGLPYEEALEMSYDNLRVAYDQLTRQKSEFFAKFEELQAEVNEWKERYAHLQNHSVLTEEVHKLEEDRDRLLLACKASYKLPRPWMVVGNISWPEWDAVWVQLEHAIDGR